MVIEIRQVKLIKGKKADIDAMGPRDPYALYEITDEKPVSATSTDEQVMAAKLLVPELSVGESKSQLNIHADEQGGVSVITAAEMSFSATAFDFDVAPSVSVPKEYDELADDQLVTKGQVKTGLSISQITADLSSLVDGTATTFDLPPAATHGYSVYVNGALVLPTGETDATFTLSEAPAEGSALVVVYLSIA